jgi:hypothetical protein
MNLPRARGRPRGKHRSADLKLLQYLALVSVKYGIAADAFFDGLVEAWQHQASQCKSLSIECRKKTLNDVVFLLTDGFKVVAQFSMPTHLLAETNPLEEFVRASASRRTKREGNTMRHPQIGDLRSGMNRIDLEARVLEIPKPRSVITRFGGFATVANASITDDTGVIQLPLWNQQIHAVSVGDRIQVENARVVTFRGEPQLKISRDGQLRVLEEK